MSERVLFCVLSLRQSQKTARDYVTGWLGHSRLIGFEGDPDRFGNRTINLYLEAMPPKEERPLVTVRQDQAITYSRQD